MDDRPVMGDLGRGSETELAEKRLYGDVWLERYNIIWLRSLICVFHTDDDWVGMWHKLRAFDAGKVSCPSEAPGGRRGVCIFKHAYVGEGKH